jgi:hypothetical protein
MRFLDETYPDHMRRPDLPLFREAVEQCHLFSTSARATVSSDSELSEAIPLILHQGLRAVAFQHDIVARLLRDKRPLSHEEVETLTPMKDSLVVLLISDDNRVTFAKYVSCRAWELLRRFEKAQSMNTFLGQLEAMRTQGDRAKIRRILRAAIANNWLVVAPGARERNTLSAAAEVPGRYS